MFTLFPKHSFTHFIKLWRTRTMLGKMIKNYQDNKTTNIISRKGKFFLNIVCSSSSGAIPLMTYIFVPTGGEIASVSSSIKMITPNLSDVNYFSSVGLSLFDWDINNIPCHGLRLAWRSNRLDRQGIFRSRDPQRLWDRCQMSEKENAADIARDKGLSPPFRNSVDKAIQDKWGGGFPLR